MNIIVLYVQENCSSCKKKNNNFNMHIPSIYILIFQTLECKCLEYDYYIRDITVTACYYLLTKAFTWHKIKLQPIPTTKSQSSQTKFPAEFSVPNCNNSSLAVRSSWIDVLLDILIYWDIWPGCTTYQAFISVVTLPGSLY